MGSREPVPVRSFVVINRDMRNTTMFGLNRAEVIGRLGADVIVKHIRAPVVLSPVPGCSGTREHPFRPLLGTVTQNTRSVSTGSPVT